MEQYKESLPVSGLLIRQVASIPALHQAWRKVRANRGAAGVDAVNLRAFEQNLMANLAELSRNLLSGSYEPLPARYVNIPKSNGSIRELAIPTVRDRIAQRAVLDLIEPIFEPQFLDCSFAFRPGRSVEMAVQRLIVARARGFKWVVDADIKDFFPSISHDLLLAELERSITDREILDLVRLWLDAGALDGKRPTSSWLSRWRSSLAEANLAARDGIDRMLNKTLSEQLGISVEAYFDHLSLDSAETLDHERPLSLSDRADASGGSNIGRLAMRRLIKDGLLLALAERTVLKGALNLKTLGIGGSALLAVSMAPPIIRKLKSLTANKSGALQGSPISPLLSNIYLQRFDLAITRQGYKLTRYCDDFIILCRDEAEAREAIKKTRDCLKERRLQLNLEKTRIVSPDEPFEFLGYHFEPGGRVIAPPSIPEVVSRRVTDLADRYLRRSSAQVSAFSRKARTALGQAKGKLKRWHS